ncbi:Hypothetical protein D9617_1g084480 [Elsinoe fawcettii]|nr:Hypothetical protein D9617_1g084480 [Elsinoe fawcettii]
MSRNALLRVVIGLSWASTAAAATCQFSWPASESDRNCLDFLSSFGLAHHELVAMNPSLGDNCSNGMIPGQHYCVIADGPGPATIVSSDEADWSTSTWSSSQTSTSPIATTTTSRIRSATASTSGSFPGGAFPSGAVFTGNFVAVGPSGTVTMRFGNAATEETSSASTESTSVSSIPSAAASGATSTPSSGASSWRMAGGGLVVGALGAAVMLV